MLSAHSRESFYLKQIAEPATKNGPSGRDPDQITSQFYEEATAILAWTAPFILLFSSLSVSSPKQQPLLERNGEETQCTPCNSSIITN